VAKATTSFAVALLFAELGSLVEELTLAVWLTVAPEFTFTTNVKLAGEEGARAPIVQVRVPTLQVHPAGPVKDWAVVLAGSVSVSVILLAVLGPLLVTTCVYVMLLFTWTGTGLAEFVTDRSAEPATWMLAEALLLLRFGSAGVVSATDAVSVIVDPGATPALTVTTNEKLAVAFAARGFPALFVHRRVTTLHVHPAGPVKLTAVVFAGSVSVRVIEAAAAEPAVAGPPFATIWA